MKIKTAGALALLSLFLVTGASAQTYTMQDAVLHALDANPNIEAAKKSVEASESAVKVARGNFGPTLNSAYIYTHTEPTTKARLMHTDVQDMYTFAITASQPLFSGFKNLNTMQKAELEVDYQKHQVEKTRVTIANAVQSLFLNYLMSEESVISSKRSLERAKEQLETARAAFDLGLRPKLDVLQAELDMSSTEATLIQNENSRDTCRAQLNTLLNLPVQTSSEFIGKLDRIPFDMPFESCLEKAFKQRPDLLMAQKSIDKAYKDLGIAQSTFYPQIDAKFQWSTSGMDMQASGGSLLPHSYTNVEAGITVGLNLFSSGKRYYSVKQAKSGISALESQVQAAYNSASFEVKSTLVKLQDSSRTIGVAERSLKSAQQSYADAKMRYELQLGTNLEMLTAQSDLAKAELLLISSKAAYLVALSNLYTAMGEIHPNLLP